MFWFRLDGSSDTSMRTAFSNDGLATCLADSQGIGCLGAAEAFTGEFGSMVNIAFWAGAPDRARVDRVLVSAPLIARKPEYGIRRLAWSQTVPRARWLATKLALVNGRSDNPGRRGRPGRQRHTTGATQTITPREGYGHG